MATCTELRVPLAANMSVGPTTGITFLGIEIDTLAMEFRLPRGKLNRLKDLLSEWQFKKVCSKVMLESLLGHLNHACSVVRPRRVNCDNEAVVAVLNSGYSRDHSSCRCIFFFCAKYDVCLSAAHIPGHLNVLADAISQNDGQLSLFLLTGNPCPTLIPSEII